jgi:hypothetical protein
MKDDEVEHDNRETQNLGASDGNIADGSASAS